MLRFYGLLAEERTALPAAPDDLGELRYMTRAFITASMRLPELANLANHEAATAGERLDHIFSTGFAPGMTLFAEMLDGLVARGVIYPITVRDAFFIIDAGMSPFVQPALSSSFDAVAGSFDIATHVDSFLDFVFRGLVRPSTSNP